ncbi:MAG TPA: hypothetical protein VK892_21610 [Pyrinomonadaceae bacterium]|nr:hypothetical protein [Pyrinomonadaceae bacterium]
MNKRILILLIGTLLVALPVLAIIESHSHSFVKTSDFERCSNEVEELKLCVENSIVTVSSGEQVQIKLVWVNSSDADRRIGNRRSGYSVTVTDKNGKKLIPVFEQKLIERQERIRKSGEEDKGIILRTFSGSDRGLYAEAKGIEKDKILLNDKMYDYDLTSKGIYFVTISKKVASLEKGKTIEIVLNDIEIRVK